MALSLEVHFERRYYSIFISRLSLCVFCENFRHEKRIRQLFIEEQKRLDIIILSNKKIEIRNVKVTYIFHYIIGSQFNSQTSSELKLFQQDRKNLKL
jgi:hypothetical protein